MPLLPLILRVTRALGELNGIGRMLPNPYLLVRPFLRKEAAASSKIEGTVTGLPDLFAFELDEQASEAPADAREVLNYVRALEAALAALDLLPISTRLLRDAHKTLLTGVAKHRGAHVVPGEFRREQNWIGASAIGNARFVPPPYVEAIKAMSALEKYLNRDTDDIPFVVDLAFAHYQFEAIHPFPDGNGRIGRLLMPLMLCASGHLSRPLLYLSAFLERNYDSYIDHMFNVSARGEWIEWIAFFLGGIEETATNAVRTIQALQDLRNSYLQVVQTARSSALLGRVVALLFESPVLNIPRLAEDLCITYNTAKKTVERLEAVGIIKDFGWRRPKIWFAPDIVGILSAF